MGVGHVLVLGTHVELAEKPCADLLILTGRFGATRRSATDQANIRLIRAPHPTHRHDQGAANPHALWGSNLKSSG